MKQAENITGYGTLFVVATPIGNLEDITLRALRILSEVDYIAAEDTRYSRKLLTHFNISTPALSYYKEREQQRSEVIMKKLQDGFDIALVSDAGTPGISDPGAILVQKAAAANIPIVPVPGPSALTTALSIAGLTESTFIFLGFTPSRKKQRQDLLKSLNQENRQLIFFEAPHRLRSFLQDCLVILGDRKVMWFRELTKMYEEHIRGSVNDILRQCEDKRVKGESVLIISGAEDILRITDNDIRVLLLKFKQGGNTSLKDAVRLVAEAHNLSRSAVYRLALEIWQ